MKPRLYNIDVEGKTGCNGHFCMINQVVIFGLVVANLSNRILSTWPANSIVDSSLLRYRVSISTISLGSPPSISTAGGSKKPNGPFGSRSSCSANMSSSCGASYQSLIESPWVGSCPIRYALACLLRPDLLAMVATQCRSSFGRRWGSLHGFGKSRVVWRGFERLFKVGWFEFMEEMAELPFSL